MTSKTEPTKPLVSHFEKTKVIATLSNPNASPKALAWAHYLIGRALIRNNIEPYAIEGGRAVRRLKS